MTDRPIIFSAPMVKALLDGRKTQTRRLVKPAPQTFMVDGQLCEVALYFGEGEPWPRIRCGRVITCQEVRYRPGLRLWVRETFATGPINHGWGNPIYKATFTPMMAPVCEGFTPWRSPIHMPRWASRITLTVTDVRVQRLQEISEEDAEAEGRPICHQCGGCGWQNTGPDGGVQCNAWMCGEPDREWFGATWNHIHGPGAWDANPDVVVISFQCEQRNIDA